MHILRFLGKDSASFRQERKDSAILRQERKDVKLCERIVTALGREGPQRVVLSGKSGTGKTRLARKVGEYATEEGLCYSTLWLHLNKRFDDELSLYENIAFQIKVYNGEENKATDLLKEKIIAELTKKKRLAGRDEMKTGTDEREKSLTSADVMVPYLLLIFDDEGNKTSEDEVMTGLGLESLLREHEYAQNIKIIVTRREREGNTRECGEIIESQDKSEEDIESYDTDESQDTNSEEGIGSDDTDQPQDLQCEGKTEPRDLEGPHDTICEEVTETHSVEKCYGVLRFYTTDESQALLGTLTEDSMLDLFESLIKDEARELLKSLQKNWKIEEPLTSRVARKSSSLPAAVVMLAESLNCITRQNSFKSLSSKQDKVLKEALSNCDPACSYAGYNPILQLAYQLLETDDTWKNAIVDCFWHTLDFYELCGCIHYRELITQWILEGYFDPVRSVKKAYNDGHAILVELINRGILKTQEGDMVVPEMAMKNLIDLRDHGLLSRSRLRFARVYGGVKSKGIGNIIQKDDMIKTVEAKKRDNIYTILVSGNRLRRETPIEFFKKPQMKDLEVVALFDPTLEYLSQSLRELKQLRVLVIRDYDHLTSMEELKDLRRLEVLEVSGASSVENISDEFFEAASELQSLNLSGLGIKSLPSSISQLKHLHSLILRDCYLLEDLPDIQNLEKLEVVDVRGAHNLETCFGKNFDTRRNQTFSYLCKLQLVDFSESKIKRLPMFHDADKQLHSLKRLSLQNCSNLIKLPNLKPLSGLQILDLSGTTSLVDIAAVCFEQKKELKILNLSSTKFTELPSTIFELSNLSQLLLRDSTNLEAIPNIEGLTSLEVFDVSGCTNLQKIEGSFKDMSYLCKVNLSGTRIETVPELPDESGILCSKLIILADSRRWIHDTWGQVKEAITKGMSESLSSSDMVDRVEEISRKESGRRVDELWAFDCPEKKERLREHIYRDVYMNTIPFVDTKSYHEVLEIQGSNGVDQDKETLAKAEFVAFLDNNTARLSSVFSDLKSVKGCWLEMCGDIQRLFSGVDEECLRNLETMSVTNLRLMDSICSSSFKNLKKLSLDCCPSIITLFPASEPPISLEVLKIKFCDKLEKLFEEEVELPNLHTLCLFELPVLSTLSAKLPNLERYKKLKCPKLKSSQENLKRGNGSDDIVCDSDCKEVKHGDDI